MTTRNPTLDLTLLDKTPALNLDITGAAIDWGYKDNEAKQPEQVPYYCELTAVWYDAQTSSYIAVSTYGLIYPRVLDGNKFGGWNLSRFEADYICNMDAYDQENRQDNEQGFELSCDHDYTNRADVSQTTADKLDGVINNITAYTVGISYSNGMVELVGLEA